MGSTLPGPLGMGFWPGMPSFPGFPGMSGFASTAGMPHMANMANMPGMPNAPTPGVLPKVPSHSTVGEAQGADDVHSFRWGGECSKAFRWGNEEGFQKGFQAGKDSKGMGKGAQPMGVMGHAGMEVPGRSFSYGPAKGMGKLSERGSPYGGKGASGACGGQPQHANLFIGNLGLSISEAELKELFATCGMPAPT